MSDPAPVLSELSIPPARRAVAAGAPALLGVVLAATALAEPALSPLGRGLMVTLGGLAVVQARSVWRGSAVRLQLTPTSLRDSAGHELAPLAEIVSVDTGFFALKPSNGFLLRLARPAPPAWVPGLYWRRGTRIGIGGAASGRAAREFAQLVELARQGRI